MDKVGIDGAVFISPFPCTLRRSYAVEVQRIHPPARDRQAGRPSRSGNADVIADWKKTPGTVGIRIMLTKEATREPNDPGLDRSSAPPFAMTFRSTSSAGTISTWAPR